MGRGNASEPLILPEPSANASEEMQLDSLPQLTRLSPQDLSQ